MNVEKSKAVLVWDLFRQLSRIPRESKNEEQVCQWLEGLAREQSWDCRRDAVGNIVMSVPPTAGWETAPIVILQAHTDMVCEKMPESDHDFGSDAIQLVEKEGWLYGDQTTLGADNGLGVCMALAAGLEKNLPHPGLELLFTVDEETGLTGANGLAPGFVKGQRLINLDSEDEGVFTIGCAGGIRSEINLGVTWDAVPDGFLAYDLNVSGLTGGHSGVNIDEQRANAIKLLARFLERLRESVDLRLVDLRGGNADNALPRDGQALVLLGSEGYEKAQGLLKTFVDEVQCEFRQTDPSLAISLTLATPSEVSGALDSSSTGAIIDLLVALPHGVLRYSQEFVGIVETSNNLAKVVLDCDRNCCVVTTSQRSFNEVCRDELTEQIHAVATLAGAHAKNSMGYPAWQPQASSKILEICQELYQEISGKEPIIEVIHAGLECGIFAAKYSGLDMISLGPTIENPHSPQERVNIESVDQVWEFLVHLLERLV